MYMIPHPSIATFHETNEDGNKAGKKQTGHTKAGTYTQLSSSLHQKERGENEGTAQRETRTIKTNRKREKKKNITSRSVMKHALFIKGQSKGQSVFLSTRARVRGSPRGRPCLQSCLLRASLEQLGEGTPCARADSGRDKASLRQSPS